VIVTGGAGFIGSHLVDRLVAGGHDVLSVDDLDPAAHGGPPAWAAPGAEHVLADVRDPSVWDRVLPGADAVAHQAAKVGLGVDVHDVEDYVSNNDLGTAVMLRAMARHRFRGRLVLASSMVVYGEGAYACPDHGPVRPGPRTEQDLGAGRFEPRCPECGSELVPGLVGEDAATNPRNVYAATKLAQEHLCAAVGRELGLTVRALRYHNVYGPRMPRDTPYAGVASIFRSRLAAGERPRLFEDGGQRRDFVHVADVARANELALLDDGPADGAFNVASGRPVTLLRMAEILAEADGRGLAPEVVGGYRLGDVRHVTADPTRAAEVLGFRAEVAPEVGLARFAGDVLREPPRSAPGAVPVGHDGGRD
jgi:dTDP-L-rhamnose 4-epimerase